MKELFKLIANCRFLAVIETKIPQAAELFFPDKKERPKEAPFMALEKKYCNEELQRIARLAPNN